MLKHLTIKINLKNGETELTPKSQASIKEMRKKADLLDYDLLSDMHFMDAWIDGVIAKREKENAS